MVEDLQRSSREKREGEDEPQLVVRADGSEMVKVRKRKRRSKQPGKEAAKKRRKTRFLIIATTMVFGVLVCISAAITYGYHNSQTFQTKVVQTIMSQSGAEVELGALTVGPTSADLKDITLNWDEAGGAIEEISLKKVTTSYGMAGFFGGEWNLGGIDAFEGHMVLRNVEKPALSTSNSKFVDYENDFIHCLKMDIYFGEMRRTPDIEGSDVQLAMFKNSEPPHVLLNGGTFNLKGLEGLQIDNALLKLQGDQGDMYLRITDEERYGSLILEGKMPFRMNDRAKLNAKMEMFPIQKLLSSKTQRFFSGRINSDDAVFDIKPDQLDNVSCNATFKASTMRISGFPFLKGLSDMIGNNWYSRPVFNRDVSGEIERVGDKLYISNFRARDNKYLKIEGDFMVEADGKVKGSFKVSIPEESASFSRRAPEGLFDRPYDGFVSTIVQISGSVHNVKDDFESRVIALTGKGIEPSTENETVEDDVVQPQQPETDQGPAPNNRQIEEEFFEK